MTSDKYKIVLASQSPRRKELLGHLGLDFEIIPSNVEEISEEVKPIKVVADLARLKGRDVLSKLGENHLIISSDTIVVLDDIIYGKPKDVKQAEEILKKLSGKTHQVMTSVYLCTADIDREFTCITDVTFDSISEDILQAYLATGDSLDKAGAYGIQGKGLSFISKISGSYSNVVGLPISHLKTELDLFIERLNAL